MHRKTQTRNGQTRLTRRGRALSRAGAAALLALVSPIAAFADANPVASVRTDSHGAVISLQHGALRLDAFAPRVIHIQYSADGKFAPQRVPTVIAAPQPPKFHLDEGADAVTLVSPEVQARVDRKTGSVTFLNSAGKTILAEEQGGRTLTPITLAGPTPASAFQSKQVFALPADEAVYGLGQHQDGYLDYRGTSVTLEQVNREVAVPFMVSSRGYGLLWNNPAHTEINAGGERSPIPAVSLFDDDGKPGGLTGHYFKGANFETETSKRQDAQIDFNWNTVPPPGQDLNQYSVRWTGTIQAQAAGDYTFITAADDGIHLWIDDKQVINDWADHPVTTDVAKVHFEANSRHKIRMEYYQAGGGAEVHLTWVRPDANPQLSWASEAADGIDYYFFYGPSIDQVMADYRHATGNAPMPPKWGLGYWQSKEKYNTQQEWLDIAAEYRNRKDPIDNIVQDWFYWDPSPWGSHKFDPKRFPDPAAAIAALHDQYNMHFMISVWGKFNPGTPTNQSENYNLLNSKGYLYPENVNSDRFYDAFNPAARTLYWDLMRDQIFNKGVDAWWLDASEPEVNMQAFRATQTEAGLGAQVLNAWPLMHTTAVSEGQLKAAPDKRVFILTRSAYAGQQRTGAATWSGDITASWQVFANQIPAGLNFGLSGIPYWTTDIGAFFVNYPGGHDNPEYRELYTRWFQFGAFCPIFRSHGTNTSREMWQFGPETEKTLLKYDNLRYRLMPYIYSQAWQVTSHGGTIMRALVMDFPGDVTARESKDEFLFGPSILVCPVTKYQAASRDVILPKGTDWTDFWTGKSYKGGQTVSSATPIDTMPLFVRSGSIVPMGPYLQYAAEKPADPIELRVYPGADASFTLYEDEGDNNNYERGKYATIPLAWNERRKTLTIGERSGSFPGMLAKRTFHIVLVKPDTGVGVEAVEAAKTVIYEGKTVTVKE